MDKRATAANAPKPDTGQASALFETPESPVRIVGVANSGSLRNKMRRALQVQSSPHAGTPQSPSPARPHLCTQAPGCTRRMDHPVASKPPLRAPLAPAPFFAAPATQFPDSSWQPQNPDPPPAIVQSISAPP